MQPAPSARALLIGAHLQLNLRLHLQRQREHLQLLLLATHKSGPGAKAAPEHKNQSQGWPPASGAWPSPGSARQEAAPPASDQLIEVIDLSVGARDRKSPTSPPVAPAPASQLASANDKVDAEPNLSAVPNEQSQHKHSNGARRAASHRKRRRRNKQGRPRTRTMFTDWQLGELEWRFQRNKYLITSDRLRIAKLLGLDQLQVKTWFQNRRMKWKKQILASGSGAKSPTKPKGRPRRDSIPPIEDL